MRGYKYYNFPAFDRAEQFIEDCLEYKAISPANIDRASGFDPFELPDDHDWNSIPEGFDFKHCRERDIEAIESCDGIFMLVGWENSKGAVAEKAYAEWAMKEVYYEQDFIDDSVFAKPNNDRPKEGNFKHFDTSKQEAIVKMVVDAHDNASARAMESRTKATNPKDAIGSMKAKFSTVPMGVVLQVGLAMLEGMCKYGRHNYRAIGVRSSVYYDAIMGHIADWWEGQDIDPDSGLNHIDKAIASAFVLRDAINQGKLEDDRPPRSRVFKSDFNADAKRLIEMHADKNPHHYTIKDDDESVKS